MKKMVVVILPLLCLGLSLFCAPKEITFLGYSVPEEDPTEKHALALFKADFPDVTVKRLNANMQDGSTISIDALLAAGKAPNVYWDALVRASKLITLDYALGLDGYVRDLDKYAPGVLDPFRKGGKVLAVPCVGGVQGMCVNLDIMDEIGFVVPDRWTIDDFLVMAEKVKTFYKGKKYATGMFAANQSGDYLINNWFASFGVQMYRSGDYSKTTVATTGGDKTYAFFQTLVRKGYIPAGAATLNDDDYCADWSKGLYAATAFFPGWQKDYWNTAIEQGFIKAPFRVKYVPFPRATGVANTQVISSNYAALVVHKTGTEADTWAARFVEYYNDAYAQNIGITRGYIGNRTDTTVKSTDPNNEAVAKIVQAGGIMDIGLTNPRYTATRAQHYPVLQKVLNLAITPEAGIKEYEARLNDVLR
jgi:ABC-type glycerol-3-phosphate transport system substrate-binding protein